jgi:hypothetical protein
MGPARVSFSRKQDRIRFDPASADGNDCVCIGSISQTQGPWTILVPREKGWFRWVPVASSDEDRSLAGSRVMKAVLERKYCAPGNESIAIAPQWVLALTQRPGGANVRNERRVTDGKYELIEFETVQRRNKPLWNGGLEVSRTITTGTQRWCPALGVMYSMLGNLKEEPLAPGVFEIPNGYHEMFKRDSDIKPAMLLRFACPPGFQKATVFPASIYQDVKVGEEAGVAAYERASKGEPGRDVVIDLAHAEFASEKVAGAYAEQLRTQTIFRPRRIDGEVYDEWEQTPTAGEASFWREATELVFRRGRHVFVLSSVTNDPPKFRGRTQLLREVAPRVDERLRALPEGSR